MRLRTAALLLLCACGEPEVLPSSPADLGNPSATPSCVRDLDCAWLVCLNGGRAVCQPLVVETGRRSCSCGRP